MRECLSYFYPMQYSIAGLLYASANVTVSKIQRFNIDVKWFLRECGERKWIVEISE
jgi:hypothetical protein